MEHISTLHAFKRHARPILAGVALGITVIWAQNVIASPIQPIENMAKEAHTCAQAIATQERRQAIPQGLLKAISHAESGRWNPQNAEILAWPWTVTTGGKGYFLPNRVDAVAFVEALQDNGVQNIDVGCMQINLKYHPEAFSSIEEAFNPRANAAYAADFLRERFAVSGSWINAAGDYHSTTKDLNKAYRQKVAKLWKDTQSTAASESNAPFQMAAATIQPPDASLSKRFNEQFRARRAGAGTSHVGQTITNRQKALIPGAQMGFAKGQNNAISFAQKRAAQLKAWRQDNGKTSFRP